MNDIYYEPIKASEMDDQGAINLAMGIIDGMLREYSHSGYFDEEWYDLLSCRLLPNARTMLNRVDYNLHKYQSYRVPAELIFERRN